MKQKKVIRCKGTRQLAYLAGIIDGEGTIGIYHNIKRNEYRLKLYVVNTDERLIAWLKNNFGGLVYSRISAKNPHWKRKWEWHLSDTSEILKQIVNYLIIKKENAKLAIEFRKTFIHKGYHLGEKKDDVKRVRKILCEKMKKLNHRV